MEFLKKHFWKILIGIAVLVAIYFAWEKFGKKATNNAGGDKGKTPKTPTTDVAGTTPSDEGSAAPKSDVYKY